MLSVNTKSGAYIDYLKRNVRITDVCFKECVNYIILLNNCIIAFRAVLQKQFAKSYIYQVQDYEKTCLFLKSLTGDSLSALVF